MKSPNSTLRRILASGFLVILLLVIGVQGFQALKALAQDAEKGVNTPPLTRVDVLNLTLQDYRENLVGYGRARAIRQTVVSSEVQGLVRTLAPTLAAGGHVPSDQTLVTIDDRDYRETLGRHKATQSQNDAEHQRQLAEIVDLKTQLEVAESELSLSLKELDRRIRMQATNVASIDEVDRQRRATKNVELAKLRIESSIKLGQINVTRIEAMMAATRLDIQRAERDIARCQLSAPYAGVIESRAVQIGTRISVGSELYRILDPGIIEIPVTLPATYYRDVELGAEVKLTGGDLNQDSWTAKIERISPSVSATDRTFQVFAVVLETKEKKAPTPGAFLKAKILGALRKDVYVIPRTAFLEEFILVLAPGQDDQRAIVEGLKLRIDRLLPDYALTRDPRAKNRDVVLNSLERIASGSKVEVLRRKTTLNEEESAK